MKLDTLIRTISNYPKPGIEFRDITTLLLEPGALAYCVDAVAEHRTETKIDLVSGIEARGFIFGAALAYKLGVGFVPIRKPGKLPAETLEREFDLEYGRDTIEIHRDAIANGDRVLLVDDLIATGGTAAAAVELLREAGGEVVGCDFVVSLPDLGGADRLVQLGCSVHWLTEFAGE
jgi:adenine phosphoribosyltransferase